MERIENIGFGNLKLIQRPEEFCYGVDAVLLADFAWSLFPGFKNAVDLGTGTGIIPFILSHKNHAASFTGIEVQHQYVEMAGRSCRLNGLEDRISFVEGDVSDPVLTAVKKAPVDLVTCNPPYFAKGGGIPSKNRAKYIARHETTAAVEDFIRTAAGFLEKGGHFFMVHRPSRLVDIFYHCRKAGLEPKDLRYVTPKPSEAPNIVLIHCVLGGGRELNMMRELSVYDKEGNYSSEIQRIYERGQISIQI